MRGLVVKDKQIQLKDDLDIPRPEAHEALVRVVCASVNPTDLENIQGKYDWLLKLSGGNHPVKTGLEFSGVVVKGSGRFQENDKVFGYVDLLKGLKSHQDYLTIAEDYIALMPENLSFAQAAALPLGALTSLVALTEVGGVDTGTKLLVNGAAGGLGVYAVQLAKILGASVTAVAGAGQSEFLHELGADEVINYKETPIETLPQTYDVIFDPSNKRRFSEVRRLLTKTGVFIPAEPNKHLLSILLGYFSVKKTKYLMVDKGDHQKLAQIAEWVQNGRLRVFVDGVYKFEEYERAFQRLSANGKQGRIILSIENPSDTE